MEKRAAELIQAKERIVRLEQEVTEAREIAESERFERELLVREKAAALRRIDELELKGVDNADVSKSSEREHRLEMEKRLAEMESAAGRALAQLEAERTERQRLEAERISFEKRILEMEEALRRTAVRDDAGGLHPSRHGTASAPPPRIVRRPPPKDAFFHVDWDLGSVEYESPEDILEVHQSMNMAQLSLEGYHGQHCLAWIVGLKKGKSRQVHVVFALSESGLNLIYSPANPIRNNEDYKRALSEAVKFLEVVGYLPEKVSLKKSPSEQGDALKSIPVLQVTRKKAQGF
jgi:hypothetical protein